MKKSLLSITTLLSLVISVGTAQTSTTKISPCNTYKAQEDYIKNIPGYKAQLDAVNAKNAQEFEAYRRALALSRSTSSNPASYTYTIPVVFHILHTNGSENIADAVCIAALDQVNKDYGRRSPDTTSIDPVYEPLYVNSHMKFVLAKKDPSGNCTTGIVHHYDKDTEWEQSNLYAYKYSTVGTYNWSSARYLNVYIVDNIIPQGSVLGGGTIVGYTHIPGTAPNVGSDAIVYNCHFLSGLQARSLSHEIGHWFGLSHTFGGSNDAGVRCGNDDIYDTPATAGFYSNCPLPYAALNDSCDPGHRPNMNNIMDYSGCPLMFTQGQTDKMRFSAESSTANRDYLVDTANLVFTGIYNKNIVSINTNTVNGHVDTTFSYAVAPANVCAPIADFYATKAKMCQGQTLVYNSTSFNNATGLTYAWEFEGGSPATSTAASPSVIYANAGNYSTTLTITNANGTSTKVRSPFPSVSWHVDQASYPAMEGFESSSSLPTGWSITNPDYGSITWQYANYGSNSSRCMVLPNANGFGQTFTGTNIDMLETNQYNFNNTTNITLSYDYSYARKPGAAGDAFAFEYSTDCGGTWSTLGTTPTTTVMAVSGGTVSAPYVPYSQAKWVTKTYAASVMGPMNGKSDVKFRFWFQNGQAGDAQNLYIDNLNITGTVGLEELANTIGLSIYPNPTLSSSTVEFTSPVNAKIIVSVIDVTGRLVEENNFDVIAGSLTKYDVNKNASLKAGIYFVTLNLNNQKVTKKLIIE
ncbi:MAG: M43 family zinc metalloprotease [Bacteroidota bacterium]